MARCLRDYPRAPHAETNLLSARDIYSSSSNQERTTTANNSTTACANGDWWHALQGMKDAKVKMRWRAALRWATLGYQHNWDTKRYSEGRRQPFPDDLAALAAYVVAVVLGSGINHDLQERASYAAQAAIVNFYPQGSTLAGHTDHSERNLDAPLLSFR